MDMFEVGRRVVYGVHGVCEIVDDTVRVIDRKKIRFLVLEPLDQRGARFYVPAENPAVLAKLHPLMSKEALDALLYSDEVRSGSWIQDENQRKQQYRELIGSGDRVAILRMVHQLHQHKKLQQSQGRKFHLCDENFLKDAQKQLEAEFCLVLGLEPEEVASYVTNALEK